MQTRDRIIEVTQAVIDYSQRQSSSHCMIAEAIRHALPEASHISVDLQTIRFSVRERGERYTFLTPPVCQQRLIEFDQGIETPPWRFRLPKQPAHIAPMRVREGERKDNQGQRERKRVLDRGKTASHHPVVRGGSPPPTAVLAAGLGKTRVFGIAATHGLHLQQKGEGDAGETRQDRPEQAAL